MSSNPNLKSNLWGFPSSPQEANGPNLTKVQKEKKTKDLGTCLSNHSIKNFHDITLIPLFYPSTLHILPS